MCIDSIVCWLLWSFGKQLGGLISTVNNKHVQYDHNNPPPPHHTQGDKDQDSVGNACDNDIDVDEDGIQDNLDTCPEEPNCDQVDTDGDGVGDMCDHDSDADGVFDVSDNCLQVPNPDQADEDGEIWAYI